MSAARNTEPQHLGMATPSSVLRLLFENFQGKLTREELEHLATADECAQSIARSAAAVANGLGSLVANDGAADPTARAGNFQGADEVSSLLFLFGAVFEQLEDLSFIAGEANALCRRPDLAASPKGGAR